MPAADRLAVDIDAGLAATLRELVASRDPGAAAPLLPSAVLDRFAVAGCRAEVVARLRSLLGQVRPELVLFEAHDYSSEYIDDAAALAREAGVALYPLA
jgi:hypothetical protein